MTAALDSLMQTAHAIRARGERDRSARVAERLHAAAGNPELPIESGPRSGSMSSLASLLQENPVARPRGAPVAPAWSTPIASLDPPATGTDRLEQLERELCVLLARSTPATWRSSRRPLTRMLRAARRELRALERASCLS